MAELTPVIVCLTQGGVATAEKIVDCIGGEIHGLRGRVDTADVVFNDTLSHLGDIYLGGRPIVGVCSAGIVIRALAPYLNDKHSEPPVLAVSEDGRSVVPLLGGHHGANRYARRLEAEAGFAAAITTAGDVALGIALDEPPEFWRLSNPEHVKAFTASALAGASIAVEGDGWWSGHAFTRSDAPTAPASGGATRSGSVKALRLVATEAPVTGDADCLVYHPRQYVLGLGAARGCPVDELAHLVTRMLSDAGIAEGSLRAIASLDLKADEPAINALGRSLDIPVWFYGSARLEKEAPRLPNPSDIVFRETGCHGVAEGAALAAAGPEGHLVAEKRKSEHATCALAHIGAEPEPGTLRGRVSLIGVGPGWNGWRTPQASQLVAQADALVGYGLYIDLLGRQSHGKPRHDFPLGSEEARCRFALEEAARGRDIAIICSGDAGIYAMGALVHELLDRPQDAGGVSERARRVEIVSAPGITAMQAAAARTGAPLGHDFCAISLSDLLTPRDQILRRVHAAAEGDFVIAFYNPVSVKRRTLLAQARAILLDHRPAGTPVILAASLGRPAETVRILTLDALNVDDVDMLTTVIIGSSESRILHHGDGPRVYTPRGYARHHDKLSTAEGAS